MQIPEIIIYWYSILKRKWNDRHQIEPIDTGIIAPIAEETENSSKQNLQCKRLSTARTYSDTLETVSRAVYDVEKKQESMSKDFERIDKEMKKVVAEMKFNDARFEDIELAIAGMKNIQHVDKC